MLPHATRDGGSDGWTITVGSRPITDVAATGDARGTVHSISIDLSDLTNEVCTCDQLINLDEVPRD